MKPVTPFQAHSGGKIVVFAKDQPQYQELPASCDVSGLVMTEWEPTPEEREAITAGARVRLWIYTFNEPLQPVHVEVSHVPSGDESNADAARSERRKKQPGLCEHAWGLPIAGITRCVKCGSWGRTWE